MLYFLVPFVVEVILAAMHAPPLWAGIGFVAIILGLIAWMVDFYRFSRCPVCNTLLRELFGYPMFWNRCPKCHTPFTSSG